MGYIKDENIDVLAVGLASIYTVTQEFKFHNIGENNVYDPYDVIASLIGLVMTYRLIQVFEFVEKVKIE